MRCGLQTHSSVGFCPDLCRCVCVCVSVLTGDQTPDMSTGLMETKHRQRRACVLKTRTSITQSVQTIHHLRREVDVTQTNNNVAEGEREKVTDLY